MSFEFRCHHCDSIIYDPCKVCTNCGNLLETSLWTTAREPKLNKHGLYVVSGSLQATATPFSGTAPQNTSFVSPDIDLLSSIRYTLASGSAISPVPSLSHRSESIFWYFGHTTGAGEFGGTQRYFQGIRLVYPNSPTFIHFFPDELRPEVDHTLECRGCKKVFSIVGLPENCDNCGYRFHW